MALPTNAQERKDTPIFAGVLKYFPLALAEVAKCSKAGNDQHNPGLPLQWTRSKSGDELDALTRHLLEAGTIDTDGIRHSAKVAWRALANLEKELEKAAADRIASDKMDAKSYALRTQLDKDLSSAIQNSSAYGVGGLFSSYPMYSPYPIPDTFKW